jgi:hypothetical protein
MASIFQKIGNFLNKDEVRGGLALGSALGGFGAFDGFKYGDTINKTLGGLNVASGLRAGGASGALQAGLGGYGLAQGFGKVGTFGNTYDSLMGNGQQTNMNQVKRNSFLNPVGSANGNSTTRAYTFGGNADGAFRVNNTDNLYTKGTGRLQDDVINYNNVSSQMETAPMDIMHGGVQRSEDFSDELKLRFPNSTGLKERMGPSVNYSGPLNPTSATEFQVNNSQTNDPRTFTIDNLRTNVSADYPMGNTSAPGFSPSTVNNQNDGSFTFKDITFEKVFDNIINKAMKDPLQAVAVGSALVTAFADDPAEEAAKQYAAEMARVRAQTDPNSDFGQNYIQSFSDRRTKELDDAYTKATSDFVSTMSKRGMMDSTIFTEGKASLDQRFAELKAKIPMDSQMALQDYQKAQLTNLNLGSQAAYRGGALTAGVTNPFSNTFKAAVASTQS